MNYTLKFNIISELYLKYVDNIKWFDLIETLSI